MKFHPILTRTTIGRHRFSRCILEWSNKHPRVILCFKLTLLQIWSSPPPSPGYLEIGREASTLRTVREATAGHPYRLVLRIGRGAKGILIGGDLPTGWNQPPEFEPVTNIQMASDDKII